MSVELSPEQIQKILQGISIPPQPQIMVDLQLEQLNPQASLANISRLICHDVGLAGSILKTVNSPIFGLKDKITSIGQAVSLLGVNSVVNLVNALSIKSQTFKGQMSDDDIVALGSFWDSATDVAMAAAVIAKQIGFPCPDEAYTLGLFHNAGIPLLMQRFQDYPEAMRAAYSEPRLKITDTENRYINTNHAVVGYYVGKAWHLPAYLCNAIHWHHNLEKLFADESAEPRVKTLLAILKMAEHICGNHRILGRQEEDFEWLRIEEMVLIHTGLGQYDFQNLKEQISEMGIAGGNYYC